MLQKQRNPKRQAEIEKFRKLRKNQAQVRQVSFRSHLKYDFLNGMSFIGRRYGRSTLVVHSVCDTLYVIHVTSNMLLYSKLLFQKVDRMQQQLRDQQSWTRNVMERLSRYNAVIEL